ncbi:MULTISPECIES: carbohydrate ABC transporter permease [Rhizobium/Agrobacterium group]|jgi:multiple sugar transport system permease protein|uniref:ABC transmembrane type-1 domain-containing protein n=2 Tax=Rhizobium/Agrobacterium group TaxID=227290 RepID=A0ABR5CLN4_9HYPH|nr:sugar ABC transporter permease [Rhizobium nepotum]KJF65764.1 hypothetical protein RS75_21480 [Rhizobium nepotum 39/7]KJF70958.1 hypothetical protein RP75_23580 [Agrobacterium arsenijevicii]
MQSNARAFPWIAFFFLLPTLVGLTVFRLVPVVWAFIMSFTRWQIFDQPQWVGLDNYIQILTSPAAAKVFLNTAWFTLLYVPGAIALATVLAVLLNNALRISAFFRGAFFLPYITSTVAVALAWRWIFSTKFGILNNLLLWLGVSTPPAWLADPTWALPAVAIVAIWKDSGFYMLLLLAGLQTIDTSVYEAAKIDGAKRIRQFFEITIPLLSRSLFFVLIIALVRSTQTFELTYALTGGGPNGASSTLAFFIYENAFVHFQMGYASALAYLLCFVVGFITLTNFYVRRRWVHE